ncbi:DUF4136 domain-containing protein [Sphingomonas sp. CJ99]
MPRFAVIRPAMLMLPACAVLASLGACATTPRLPPASAIRYHLGMPIEPGTIAVEALTSGSEPSLAYRAYLDAVAAELGDLGFTLVPDGQAGSSRYVAAVSFTRGSAGSVRSGSPVSIGLGGVSGSLGGAVGGGLSLGLGGRTRAVTATQLSVQLRRRDDGTTIWEGRAETQSIDATPAGDPAAVAARLADAMFDRFPGESGITVTVE